MKFVFAVAVFCGAILPKCHAWWPGFAEMALGPYFPALPFLSAPYPAYSPCGQSPCGPNPIPPCGSQCPTPEPPQACRITISPTSPVVDVPCSYALSQINGIRMQVVSDTCGSREYYYEVVVIHGPTEQYMALDPVTGYFYMNQLLVNGNMTQTIKIRAAGIPNAVFSDPVYVTFNFQSCVLGLVGPDSARVCVGYPPHTDMTAQLGQARDLWLYPQLTFSATNVHPLLPIIFDLASDATPTAGMGAPNTINGGIYSPNVLSNVGGENSVFISNYNALMSLPSTSVIGIYGASNNGAVPVCSSGASVDPATGTPGSFVTSGSCCQTLRFSVSPGVSQTPYVGSYKDVLVCYEDINSCTFT